MDERQIGLVLALKAVGASTDVSDFTSRLILQKTVYLIEQAGIRLGYAFNWYLRGPYSPALTKDLFDLSTRKEDVAEWVLDPQSLSAADRISRLFNGNENEAAETRARRLELLASLHYLARQRRVNLASADEATQQLRDKGKVFSQDEVAAAIQELRDVQLL